jgi:hypothetical protein
VCVMASQGRSEHHGKSDTRKTKNDKERKYTKECKTTSVGTPAGTNKLQGQV